MEPNRPTDPTSPCAFFDYAIHTVETDNLNYKFIGSAMVFAQVSDKSKFKFMVDKDGRVYLQDKKGHKQETSLRLYAKTTKEARIVAPLSAKAKPRNWHIAKVARMQPVLFSFNMPWLLATPVPSCSMPVVVTRGWVFELDTDDAAYEVTHAGTAPPAITISAPVRIAEKSKSEAFVLDETGKEQKVKVVKKTVKNSVGY